MSPLPGCEAPEELLRAKVFEETKWCFYCICEGCGIGRFTDPLVAAEVKELCCRSSMSTTDIMADDGLCNMTEVCICIVEQCEFPPLKETKCCACCNMKCGPELGGKEWNSDLFEKDIMDTTFWCQYCMCSGCGVVAPMSQGIFSAQFKTLCCRGSETLESPIIDGVLCGAVETFCCVWSECQCPPASPNPKIGCCTWVMNKGPYDGPAQIEMK